MRMQHPDDIRREFKLLVDLVDHAVLVQLPEGLYAREDEREIWLNLGRLARLTYVNAFMGSGKLKMALEAILWGLARLEIRTADESTPNIEAGSPLIANVHKWREACAMFEDALRTWPD